VNSSTDMIPAEAAYRDLLATGYPSSEEYAFQLAEIANWKAVFGDVWRGLATRQVAALIKMAGFSLRQGQQYTRQEEIYNRLANIYNWEVGILKQKMSRYNEADQMRDVYNQLVLDATERATSYTSEAHSHNQAAKEATMFAGYCVWLATLWLAELTQVSDRAELLVALELRKPASKRRTRAIKARNEAPGSPDAQREHQDAWKAFRATHKAVVKARKRCGTVVDAVELVVGMVYITDHG